MGTRSCIILKVRKEDIGKVVKFSPQNLPVALEEWIEKGSDGKIWRDEKGKEHSQPVELKETYIGIYCHWDGYPSGVGATLKEKFNNYDTILNLIAGGDCSSIDDRTIRHYANRGKKSQKYIYSEWKYLAPKQGKTQKDVIEQIDCAYAYLFDEKYNEWRVKSAYNLKAGFKVF